MYFFVYSVGPQTMSFTMINDLMKHLQRIQWRVVVIAGNLVWDESLKILAWLFIKDMYTNKLLYDLSKSSKSKRDIKAVFKYVKLRENTCVWRSSDV